MAYKIITAATTEPITLDQARKHLRIEPYGSPLEHPDDAYIETLITSAREWCEQYTERSFSEQTIEMALDAFPDNEIKLPLTPIKTIVSVKYVDVDGVERTVNPSNYALDDYSEPNWLLLTANNTWARTSGGANNVKIRMTTSNAAIPTPAYSAMLLMIGHLYENRQQDVLGNTRISFNSLPLGIYNLLQPYRLGMGM